MTDFIQARYNMVESQIRTNKVINERVITAMRSVARERFVPQRIMDMAYIDEDLAFGNGRFLMEPVVFARLLEAANIQPHEVVLDIGCLFGYSTAVQATLANTVVAIDSDPNFLKFANIQLKELDFCNAALFEGDMTQGYSQQAPYDVICVNGAVCAIPESLTNQLAEGGRLVCIMRSEPRGPGEAVLVQRVNDSLSQKTLFEAGTPFLAGFEPAESFVF